MQKLNTLNTVVNNTRTSIANKNIPITNSDGFLVQPDAVRAINFQDYSEELKPTIHGVNYYDYNGDLLYVYNVTDFLALTEHPAQPLHQGLVADGWNWDLADAQDFVQNTCDCLNIGGLYVTESGKTEIYINIENTDSEIYNWQVNFGMKTESGVTGTVTVDWGDGATQVVTQSATSNVNKNVYHTYETSGKYCITLLGENCYYCIGRAGGYNGIFGYSYTHERWKNQYCEKILFGRNAYVSYSSVGVWFTHLKEVSIPKEDYSNFGSYLLSERCLEQADLRGIVLPEGITTIGNLTFEYNYLMRCACLPKGSGTTIGNYAFQYCYYLDSFVIPSNCTSIGTSAFTNCRNLRRIFLPPTITTFGQYCFQGCSKLISIELPPNITALPNYMFQSCIGLKSITIPSGVTSIGNYAIDYNYDLESIICLAEIPPTLGTTRGTIYNAKIYVPYSEDHSILTAYKEATNWSTYAAKIFELDENGNIPTE